MRMFEPVVLACDQGSLDVALAVRGALELFRLNVYMHFCVQKRNVLDVLAGNVPESNYVVLCSHGLEELRADAQPEEMKMGFRAVDDSSGTWEEVAIALEPTNIPEMVNLQERTVVSLGCSSGREPLARAFLASGCRAYAGPVGAVDQDACALFAITFFYHLLAEERDPSLSWTERQAAEMAAAVDEHAGEGTHLFRYYSER